MPIYEYRCENCGHEKEAIQKFSDEPLTDCPECQKPALKKRVSAPSFRLSGSGWYETDFKTGNKKNLSGDKGSNEGGSTDKNSNSGASEKPEPSKAKSDKATASASSKNATP